MRKLCTHLLAIVALAGCHGEAQEGPLFNKNLLLPTTETKNQSTRTDGTTTTTVTVPAECNSLSSPIQKKERNACIWALISIIDSKYYSYRAGLKGLATTSGAVFDIVSLGLSTAATAAGGAAVKTVLSAINTGVTGTKTALDSDYLYNKSIEIVTNQMDADRNEQLTAIIKQMSADADKYDLTQAKDDLLRYYESGTFEAALESLQNKTASNATACQVAANTAKQKQGAGQNPESSDTTKCNPSSSAAAPGDQPPSATAPAKPAVKTAK